MVSKLTIVQEWLSQIIAVMSDVFADMCRSGSHMATGGADKVVKLWDPATGANTGSLRVRFLVD